MNVRAENEDRDARGQATEAIRQVHVPDQAVTMRLVQMRYRAMPRPSGPLVAHEKRTKTRSLVVT